MILSSQAKKFVRDFLTTLPTGEAGQRAEINSINILLEKTLISSNGYVHLMGFLNNNKIEEQYPKNILAITLKQPFASLIGMNTIYLIKSPIINENTINKPTLLNISLSELSSNLNAVLKRYKDVTQENTIDKILTICATIPESSNSGRSILQSRISAEMCILLSDRLRENYLIDPDLSIPSRSEYEKNKNNDDFLEKTVIDLDQAGFKKAAKQLARIHIDKILDPDSEYNSGITKNESHGFESKTALKLAKLSKTYLPIDGDYLKAVFKERFLTPPPGYDYRGDKLKPTIIKTIHNYDAKDVLQAIPSMFGDEQLIKLLTLDKPGLGKLYENNFNHMTSKQQYMLFEGLGEIKIEHIKHLIEKNHNTLNLVLNAYLENDPKSLSKDITTIFSNTIGSMIHQHSGYYDISDNNKETLKLVCELYCKCAPELPAEQLAEQINNRIDTLERFTKNFIPADDLTPEFLSKVGSYLNEVTRKPDKIKERVEKLLSEGNHTDAALVYNACPNFLPQSLPENEESKKSILESYIKTLLNDNIHRHTPTLTVRPHTQEFEKSIAQVIFPSQQKITSDSAKRLLTVLGKLDNKSPSVQQYYKNNIEFLYTNLETLYASRYLTEGICTNITKNLILSKDCDKESNMNIRMTVMAIANQSDESTKKEFDQYERNTLTKIKLSKNEIQVPEHLLNDSSITTITLEIKKKNSSLKEQEPLAL